MLAVPAYAGCEEDFDVLAKAVSGPVTMAAGHRAATTQMALSGYDHCMSGDVRPFGGTRDMIMARSAPTLATLNSRRHQPAGLINVIDS